jgi:hypothetical protein
MAKVAEVNYHKQQLSVAFLARWCKIICFIKHSKQYLRRGRHSSTNEGFPQKRNYCKGRREKFEKKTEPWKHIPLSYCSESKNRLKTHLIANTDRPSIPLLARYNISVWIKLLHSPNCKKPILKFHILLFCISQTKRLHGREAGIGVERKHNKRIQQGYGKYSECMVDITHNGKFEP